MNLAHSAILALAALVVTWVCFNLSEEVDSGWAENTWIVIALAALGTALVGTGFFVAELWQVTA